MDYYHLTVIYTLLFVLDIARLSDAILNGCLQKEEIQENCIFALQELIILVFYLKYPERQVLN